VLQPNIRYAGAAYWDFIDHHVALTERSLGEALEATGFTIRYCKRRFLPYTSKGSLPSWLWAVELYVRLPLLHRVFGKQTFMVGEAV
jgi:hypothetical protein